MSDQHGAGYRSSGTGTRPQSLSAAIRAAAEPLPEPGETGFGKPFDRFAGKRVVLLGEATHGTSEFYRARSAITRHLVEMHGFTIVAVEADWPDAAVVDRQARGLPPRPDQPPPFERFPVWMWRNVEMSEFFAWMWHHNGGRPRSECCRFYGLDMYNLTASIASVLTYLESIDPTAAATAREHYGCLTPWQHDPSTYGRAVLTDAYRKCEEKVVEQCRSLLEKQLEYEPHDREGFLDAAQNARLVAAAERYYRIMFYGGAEAWNLRDTQMFDTLERVLDAHGPNARAVVWAHNSHIGDARHTELGGAHGELSLGELCRRRFGEAAALIGFGTHSGTVAAASDWDGDMEVKIVRPALGESYERLFHEAGMSPALVDFGKRRELRDLLEAPMLERLIGVIYRPETERRSHYVEASLSCQFDAYVWFDETRAVHPLKVHSEHEGVPETYPFGL